MSRAGIELNGRVLIGQNLVLNWHVNGLNVPVLGRSAGKSRNFLDGSAVLPGITGHQSPVDYVGAHRCGRVDQQRDTFSHANRNDEGGSTSSSQFEV